MEKFAATVTVVAAMSSVPPVTDNAPANAVFAARTAAPPFAIDTAGLRICGGSVSGPDFVNTVAEGFHFVPLASLRSPPTVAVNAPVSAPEPPPMVTLPAIGAFDSSVTPPAPFIDTLANDDDGAPARLTDCAAPPVNSVVCASVAVNACDEKTLVCVRLPPTCSVPATKLPASLLPANSTFPDT